MRTARLFHPRPLSTGSDVVIQGDDARYLTRVLRLTSGAPLVLFDGRGGEYAAEIRATDRRAVTATVGAHRDEERESGLRVTLAQGISRGERMDHVIQKSTELGVAEIVPLVCERGVVKLAGDRAASRRDHWQRVAIGACQQCGRNRLPLVGPVTEWDEWLARPTRGSRVVLDPQAGESLASLSSPAEGITLLIGPEGGLTEAELHAAREAGFRPLTLGPRTLRTETAAVAALAVVQALWGDLA